jgi:hypothetical protein
MFKYTQLKKFSETKLNLIKEDYVRDITLPVNPFSYTGKIGFFLIRPFTANDYSFDVIFDNKESFDFFIKEFLKTNIKNIVDDGTTVKKDDVHQSYMISGFFNSALLDDVQIVFKNILNKRDIETKQTVLN